MKYYNSDLGVELPERSYAEACEVTYDNIMVSETKTNNMYITKCLCVCRMEWIFLLLLTLLVGLVKH